METLGFVVRKKETPLLPAGEEGLGVVGASRPGTEGAELLRTIRRNRFAAGHTRTHTRLTELWQTVSRIRQHQQFPLP